MYTVRFAFVPGEKWMYIKHVFDDFKDAQICQSCISEKGFVTEVIELHNMKE